MKRCVAYIATVVAILCCLLADSCSEKEELIPELSISHNGAELASSSLNFDYAGGSQTIKIESNAEWRVDCNSSWVEILPKSGNGSADVAIAVGASESSRSAVVTVAMRNTEQLRHSFNVIQYVAEKPAPNEPGDEPENPDSPDEPENPDSPDEPTDNPEDKPTDNPEDGPTDNPEDGPTEPENPEDNPTDEPTENPEDKPTDEPTEPENPEEPEQPVEPDTPEEPEQPEEPEEQTPLAITIPELIAMMKSDGSPTVIDAKRDRVVSAVVMNNPTGANYPASHLIVATEGSTEPRNGVVMYGRIVKPDVLGAKCGDRAEIFLKAGLAVAIKNNSIMYEVTGDASKQWAEVSITARGVGVAIADVTPAKLVDYQGMTVRVKSVEPLEEGAWNDSDRDGKAEFVAANGEKFTVQVLESAKFASHQFHIAQGDIMGIVAIDGDKVVLRPRTVADIAAFDGPAPEEPTEPEQPTEPEKPTEPEQPTQPEGETPDTPEGGGDDGNSGDNGEGDNGEDGGNEDNTDQPDNNEGEDDGENSDNEGGNDGNGGNGEDDNDGDKEDGGEDNGDGDKEDNPDKDEKPENPTEPETPDTPTEPETPENPTEPETPTEPEVPDTPDTPAEPSVPAEKYTEVKSLSEISAGSYYIGGYRDGELHLATGGMTAQYHCETALFTLSQGEFVAEDGHNAKPAEIILESADNGKGYYIRIAGKGYLEAIAARAGALRLSDKPNRYWLFTEHAESGFVVRQAGDIDVQIIISESATNALLRSIAGEEEGLGITLFRHNK